MYSYGLRDCTDGSSGTVAFSGSIVGIPQQVASRGNGVVGSGGTPVWGGRSVDVYRNVTQVMGDLAGCTAAWQAPGNSANVVNSRGYVWGFGVAGFTLFNTVVPPESKQHPWTSCTFYGGGGWPGGANGVNFANATSNHSGGVNVHFGDGSVRFLKDSINLNVWWNLGTRSGGEVVGSDAY